MRGEANWWSREAIVAALASARRAKPERLIERLTFEQLRHALELLGQPIGARKRELVARLFGSVGPGADARAALDFTANEAGESKRVCGGLADQKGERK